MSLMAQALAGMLLVGAFALLLRWQARRSPRPLVAWGAWSGFYAALGAAVFAVAGNAVHPLWALVFGPVAATLHALRLWAREPSDLGDSAPAHAFDLASPRAELLERSSLFGGLGLLAWCLLAPRDHAAPLILAGLAPWFATLLAVVFMREVKPLGVERLDPRPSLAGLIIAGCGGLRGALYANLTEAGQRHLTLLALGAALVLGLTWWALAPASFRPPRRAAAYALLALLAGAGSVTALNIGFAGPAQTASATVAGKSDGRDGPSLRLNGAPMLLSSDRLSVSPEAFERARIGDQVCISSRKGGLGAAWYEAGLCAKS